METKTARTKTALLVVHTNTYFVELYRVAQMFKQKGTYVPLVYFSRTYPTVDRDLALLEKDHIQYLGDFPKANPPLQDASPQKTDPISKSKSTWQRIKRFAVYKLGRASARLPGFYRQSAFYRMKQLNRRVNAIQALIKQHHIDMVILAGDHPHYDTAHFVKAAHLQNVPAVVVPSTMTDQLEIAASYHRYPPYHVNTLLKRLVVRLYPHWVYEYHGVRMLRLPSSQEILAMEWAGLAAPNPWMVNSGHADAILCESEAMFDYYRTRGIPEKQLARTGSLANDVLAQYLQGAESYRAALYERLGLPANRPMLLSALPPDQHYLPGGRPECDFATYAELVEFWVKSVAAIEGYNVVISIHPSVTYEQFKYIEDWGVKIALDPTPTLIPLCDVFVASVSSIIRWAIASGKPTINYDVYRFRYVDYLAVDGIVAMEEQPAYLSTLRQLTHDPAYYADITARQQKWAAYWGNLDGCTHERMIALFDQLIAARNQARTHRK